jgi:hypothetical protein
MFPIFRRVGNVENQEPRAALPAGIAESPAGSVR